MMWPPFSASTAAHPGDGGPGRCKGARSVTRGIGNALCGLQHGAACLGVRLDRLRQRLGEGLSTGASLAADHSDGGSKALFLVTTSCRSAQQIRTVGLTMQHSQQAVEATPVGELHDGWGRCSTVTQSCADHNAKDCAAAARVGSTTLHELRQGLPSACRAVADLRRRTQMPGRMQSWPCLLQRRWRLPRQGHRIRHSGRGQPHQRLAPVGSKQQQRRQHTGHSRTVGIGASASVTILQACWLY